ncbi:MAG TPA: ATP synthase F1 subunit gamma [Calditrichia bacterium]|nr:ATP synthase F1 subunit gamma [Calditrichota bacterium]HQU73213.1 ATP synthase F1 subunit gamma [Calditrichia bacterium]HQV33605.1 ATP synthase F1 subunit gamma [Calditrichia bacterium]
MATLKEIKQRITSIKNTQKITKAMKMVAAAKMRRAQENMFAARPYATKIKELIHRLVPNVENLDSPFLAQRPEEKVLLVVIAGDRGLCGGFNTNVIRAAVNEVKAHAGKQVSIVAVGKKSVDYFRKRNFDLVERKEGFFNHLEYAHSESITRFATKAFLSGEADVVKLIYNEFRSVAIQRPVISQLLPMRVEQEEVGVVESLYEPDQETLLKSLLPRHIGVQVWQALLESFAAEQASRMVAMENATENASELIRGLTLEYNKARQAAITTEILEIVGGAEALKNG